MMILKRRHLAQVNRHNWTTTTKYCSEIYTLQHSEDNGNRMEGMSTIIGITQLYYLLPCARKRCHNFAIRGTQCGP